MCVRLSIELPIWYSRLCTMCVCWISNKRKLKKRQGIFILVFWRPIATEYLLAPPVLQNWKRIVQQIWLTFPKNYFCKSFWYIVRFFSNCTIFQILEHWAMKLPKATDNYLSARHHSSSSNLDFSEGRGDKMGVNWRHSSPSVSRLINRKRSPQNSSLVFQSRLAFENIFEEPFSPFQFSSLF